MVGVLDIMFHIKVLEFRSFFQLPLCLGLCIFGFLPVIVSDKVRIPVLELWGRKSLEIYLWHVIPILVLKHFYQSDTSTYYILTFVILALLIMGCHWYCKRISK